MDDNINQSPHSPTRGASNVDSNTSNSSSNLSTNSSSSSSLEASSAASLIGGGTPVFRRQGNNAAISSSAASPVTSSTPLSSSSSAAASSVLGTPVVSNNQYGSIRAGITHTPLVMGTPMTPLQSSSSVAGLASNHTPITNRSTVSSVSSIARGDIGRGLGRAIFIPQSPQTSANDPYQQPTNLQGQAPPTPGDWVAFGTQSQGNAQFNSQDYLGLPPASPVIHGDAGIGGLGIGGINHGMGNGNGPQLVDAEVWGTNVNVHQAANVFRYFVENFTVGNDFEPYYLKQMQVIRRTELMILNLNCRHLKEEISTKALFEQLIQSPQEIIPIMDAVVNEVYINLYGEREGQPRIQVRAFNLPSLSRMRALDPNQIENLVALKGMVIRASHVIPDLTQAFFRCCVCAHTVEVMIDKGRIDDPGTCTSCQAPSSMAIIHNRSLFMDKQLIRLQETPDEIPEGETPCTVSLCVYGDLVDSVRPGDRVEVTGIFRALPRRINPKHRTVRSVYKTYIDVIHFRSIDQSESSGETPAGARSAVADALLAGIDASPGAALHAEQPQATENFSPERIREFETFARSGDVYSSLVAAFAPSIWEMEDVKRGVLCLLFGGTLPEAKKISLRRQREREIIRKRARRAVGGPDSFGDDLIDSNPTGMSIEDAQDPDVEAYLATLDDNGRSMQLAEEIMHESSGTNGIAVDDSVADSNLERQHTKVKQRGDINILLCGDPGTSKSQLLSYVHKITPRGIYTSGKGSSAVGLTASVVKDPETKEMVLESGALVLSDNGICCIDEFDKMNDTTRAILHEAMEQQTVSITKAGIIANLNARTSILASANPVESRYNARRSVVENIKLPPTLLSRFDLIYLILDKPNPDSDRRLARHLVSLYHPNADVAKVGPDSAVDQAFLKDYIAYARSNIAPELSDDASEMLVQGYLEMRAMGGRGGKTISATPRQLESLIRISQALAKMRLSETVTSADVEEAIRLMKVATQTAATDPRTGTIDMDLITTGRTALDRDLVLKLADELRGIFSARGGQRLTVGQIRQILIKAMTTDGSTNNNYSVSMSEVEEAVRELETEGLVQYIDRTQTVIIRGGGPAP